MPSHLFYEVDLIGMEYNFAVLFTACAALAALMQQGFQCGCIKAWIGFHGYDPKRSKIVWPGAP